MYYVYVLKSKFNDSFYVGSTKDLKRRFQEHNNAESDYTKKFLPWELVYYESYKTNKFAIKREKSLKKRAKAWQELIKRLEIER